MTDPVGDKLARIIQGDPAASAWLYDTFAGVLYRRLRARYGYPGGLDAEELLHDAFVFFLQNGARVLVNFSVRTPAEQRTESSLQRYLWDLACGVASNRRRERERHSKVVPLRNPNDIPNNGDPAEKTLDQDILLMLDECLRKRNSRVYLYFKLRYLDGLSPEHIAEATGWSRKATYKLKQALNEAVSECATRLQIR